MITNPGEYHKIWCNNADGWRWVRRGDILGYFDETFYTAMRLWVNWKRFGLPNGGGWLNEPEVVLRVITVVDEERSLYDSKSIEESRKHGSSGRVKSHSTR